MVTHSVSHLPFRHLFSPSSFSRENTENMYYFSSLALTLNELEEAVAPTDSRLRPDQRLMEAGLWDEANAQKQRLEESQRLERRKREAQTAMALEEGENQNTCCIPCLISRHLCQCAYCCAVS